MTFREALFFCTQELKNKKIEAADLEARWMLEHVLAKDLGTILMAAEEKVLPEKKLILLDCIRRRKLGEPLAYVLGYKEFYGLRFQVNKDVLIPRPETECLVENAISTIKNNFSTSQKVKVLDLGAGSGCIGFSIAKYCLQTEVHAVESSPAAVEVIRRNQDALSLIDRSQVFSQTVESFNIIENTLYDVVVANPPYIAEGDPTVEESVFTHEPHLALFAGPTGLEAILSWVKCLKRFLARQAYVIFEVGHDQADEVFHCFKGCGLFKNVYFKKDLHGIDRLVCGERY